MPHLHKALTLPAILVRHSIDLKFNEKTNQYFMGLFDKLFKKTDETIEFAKVNQQQNLAPCKTLEELLERYGGIALDKHRQTLVLII